MTAMAYRSSIASMVGTNDDDDDGDGSQLPSECRRASKKDADFAEQLKGSSDHERLLDIVDMPQHLRFNCYIHSGYRPMTSAGCCVKSLGQFHNETLNIVTHGLAFLYILFNISNLLPWDDIKVPVLPYLYFVAIEAPWFGSTVYHLFMNAMHDEVSYRRMLLVDWIGIWISLSFGPIISMYASIYCLSKSIQLSVFALYLLLSAFSLWKILVASTPWERRMSFKMLFVVRIYVYTLRTRSFGNSDFRPFRDLLIHDALLLVAAVIGATFVPERYFPGKFDYLGNSHQIMHILVLVSLYFFHSGVTNDLLWLSNDKPECHW